MWATFSNHYWQETALLFIEKNQARSKVANAAVEADPTVSPHVSPPVSPPESPTAERVAAQLREQVLTGRLGPGAPLRDVALAEEFDVSRNTIREAFRLLQAQGLTSHKRHKGTTVRRLEPADIADIYTVRRTLELRAIDESGLATEAALRALDESINTAAAVHAAREWRDLGTASLRFHGALVGLLGSPSLDSFAHTTLSRLRLAFASMPDEATFQEPWLARDAEINGFVQHGEIARAHDTLRLYLDDSQAQLLAQLRRIPNARRP